MLRKNLEVEGQALQGFYKKSEEDTRRIKSQTEKQTISQYRVANQILKKQHRDMHDKVEVTKAKLSSKNTKAAREQLLKQVKGKVRNYIRKDDEGEEVQQEVEILSD